MTWATDPIRRAIWLLREQTKMMRSCARDIERTHPGWARDWRDAAKIADEAARAADAAHGLQVDATNTKSPVREAGLRKQDPTEGESGNPNRAGSAAGSRTPNPALPIPAPRPPRES